jgi:hypothetical protein
VKIGENGIVGSEAYHAIPGNAGGWELGWITDDMNVDYESVTVPPMGSLSLTLTTGNYNGTDYHYVLGKGDYRATISLDLNNKTMLVTNHARLYVPWTVSVQGNGGIIIAPGASLVMYVAGPTAEFLGNSVINETGQAVNFQYYGLDSNTSVIFGGNGAVTGTIYAPNASLGMKGSGARGALYGAVVCKQAVMNGNFEFHYDEALAKVGPIKGYIVTRWDELTAQEVANKPVVF